MPAFINHTHVGSSFGFFPRILTPAALLILAAVSGTAASPVISPVSANLAIAAGGDANSVHRENNDRWWVYFKDKGEMSPRAQEEAVSSWLRSLPEKTLERRKLRRSDSGLADSRDLPVSADYISTVENLGAELHITSRWLNAISIYADSDTRAAISRLPFVRRIEPVRRGRIVLPLSSERAETTTTRGFYGLAQNQLSQIGITDLHADGFNGQGIVVGILDTGFQRSHEAFHQPGHELQVIAEWDFVDNDGNTAYEPGDDFGQHYHGTLILGTLAAYKPNDFVGSAYNASFVLAKTEDILGEYPAEEDNYVAGLEFAEINGADVVTSSLGYIDWYTQNDLDGQTAVTTVAVNTATANGVFCCTAAGNSYHDSNPNTSSLIAPADAYQVITCGAVDSNGVIADFSSDGPTADGRIKPEVLARGVSTFSVDPYDDHSYTSASGTSLSTPLVAGAVVCMVQARPNWTVDQMRNLLFHTASDYLANGQADPLFVRGFGVINAYNAVAADCNGNGIFDDQDIAQGFSQDCNANGIPDECDIADGTSLDENGNGIPDECEPNVPGDLNGDGCVDQADLGILLGFYGAGAGGDLDGDGDTDQADLGILLGSYGDGC